MRSFIIAGMLASGLVTSARGEQQNSVQPGPLGTEIHRQETPTTSTVEARKPLGNDTHAYVQGREFNPAGRLDGETLRGTNPHNQPEQSGSIGVGKEF